MSKTASNGPLENLNLPQVAVGNTVPLSDLVYRTIREAIWRGDLIPGVMLPQIRLANILGVSRTPVRDALLRLSQEQLVRPANWRGYVVSDFRSDEVLQIYDVRIPLEVAAAGYAAGQHIASRLAELKEIHESIMDYPDRSIEEYFKLNQRFHNLLLSPCRNDVLLGMLDQLWQMPGSFRLFAAYLIDMGGFDQMVNEHEEMVRAAESGSRERLVESVREPLELGREMTRKWLSMSGGINT